MNMKIIKTEQEYAKALERLEVLFDAKSGTKEGDELELLTLLIDMYEKEHAPSTCRTPLRPLNSAWNSSESGRKIWPRRWGSRAG